jgi:hypothetical protein
MMEKKLARMKIKLLRQVPGLERYRYKYSGATSPTNPPKQQRVGETYIHAREGVPYRTLSVRSAGPNRPAIPEGSAPTSSQHPSNRQTNRRASEGKTQISIGQSP